MKRILYSLIILLIPVVSMGQTKISSAPTSDKKLESGSYILTTNINLGSKRFNVDAGSSTSEVILDLNGKTIDAKGLSKRAVFNISRGIFKIVDNVGGGKIINSTASCFYVQPSSGKKAELHLLGGTIINCQPSDGDGGAAEICDGGSLYINNGVTIQNCRATQGAAIHVRTGAYMQMDGGIIQNNKVFAIPDEWVKPEKGSRPSGVSSNSEYKGGAVYVNDGTFVMNNGTISGNVSINGGGVYVTDGATFKLYGGTLKNNYSTSSGFNYGNGGAIYLKGGATLEIKKQEGKELIIKENAATRYGGAIFVDGSTITIDGVTINENSASSGGGLAQYGSSCTMNLKNSDINTNYSLPQNADTYKGGAGIFVSNGTLNIESSTIEKNNSKNFGGGVYLGSGTCNIEGDVLVSNNVASSNGGGIYLGGGNLNVKDSKVLTVKANTAQNGGAIYLNDGDLIVNGEIIGGGTENSDPNIAADNGGAIYLNDGIFKLNKGSFVNNKADRAGAVYIKSGTMTVNNNIVVNGNKASSKGGGGIHMAGGSLVLNGNAKMNGNEALKSKGGAIYIANGNLTLGAGKTFESNGNAAEHGGAIYLASGKIISNGTLNAGIEQPNKASDDGGAIYLAEGDFTVNNGNISNNTAKNSGGGIYMGSGELTVNGSLTINNNTASEVNGGGIFLGTGSTFSLTSAGNINIGTEGSSNKAPYGNGGGVYCAGTFNIQGRASIRYNVANNGGGVCVENGGVTLAAGKNSVIEYNNASVYGGGLYVTNSGTLNDASFNGGSFIGNSAKAGGAVCAIGNINLSLSSTMEGNSANIGGGLYMEGNVTTTFADGLIRTNRALSDGNSYSTAKENKYGSVAGVGGGIFIADDSKLKFASTITEMGIYNNVADNAGADICVNGNNTSIQLPDISTMNLRGFDVPSNSLYWVDDYFTNDTKYPATTAKPVIDRYENLLELSNNSNSKVEIYNYIVAPNTYEEKYLCLDLGYQLIFVKLETTGLNEYDDAIITLSYPTNKGESDNEDRLYRSILFTGSHSRIVGLPAGDWKVESLDWDIKYNSPTYIPAHSSDGYIQLNNNNKEVRVDFVVKEESNYQVKNFGYRKVNRMVPRKN